MADKANDAAQAAADKLAADKAAAIVAANAASAADAAAAQAADKAAADAAALSDAAPIVHLIAVTKGDTTLMINPQTLAAHKAAGWKT